MTKEIITNGPPRKARASVKRAKDIKEDVQNPRIPRAILHALLECFVELRAIHLRFGDIQNACDHSAGLRKVYVNITDDLQKYFEEVDIYINDDLKKINELVDSKEVDTILYSPKTDSELAEEIRAENDDFSVLRVLTKDEIFNRIKSVYIEVLGIEEPDKVTIYSSINNLDYEIDKLDRINFILSLQEHLDISILEGFEQHIQYISFNRLVDILALAAGK